MRFPEYYHVAPVLALDTIGSGGDADSINMKNYHRATFVITFGTLSGDAVLTVNSGATDGAKTSALTFEYALGGAAIGTATAGSTTSCDVLAASTSAATLTLTDSTYTDKMLIVEVDATKMDMANGEEWLTLSLSNAGTSGTADAIVILEPRYTGNRSETALA